jgi:hypothetical protein
MYIVFGGPVELSCQFPDPTNKATLLDFLFLEGKPLTVCDEMHSPLLLDYRLSLAVQMPRHGFADNRAAETVLLNISNPFDLGGVIMRDMRMLGEAVCCVCSILPAVEQAMQLTENCISR